MSKEKQPHTPWIVSGVVSHAVMVGCGYLIGILTGQTDLDMPMTKTVLLIAFIVTTVLGALFGLAFSKLHHRLGPIQLPLRGVLFFVAEQLLFTVPQGIDGYGSTDFFLTLPISVLIGLLFASLGRKLGGYQIETQHIPSTTMPNVVERFDR